MIQADSTKFLLFSGQTEDVSTKQLNLSLDETIPPYDNNSQKEEISIHIDRSEIETVSQHNLDAMPELQAINEQLQYENERILRDLLNREKEVNILTKRCDREESSCLILTKKLTMAKREASKAAEALEELGMVKIEASETSEALEEANEVVILKNEEIDSLQNTVNNFERKSEQLKKQVAELLAENKDLITKEKEARSQLASIDVVKDSLSPDDNSWFSFANFDVAEPSEGDFSGVGNGSMIKSTHETMAIDKESPYPHKNEAMTKIQHPEQLASIKNEMIEEQKGLALMENKSVNEKLQYDKIAQQRKQLEGQLKEAMAKIDQPEHLASIKNEMLEGQKGLAIMENKSVNEKLHYDKIARQRKQLEGQLKKTKELIPIHVMKILLSHIDELEDDHPTTSATPKSARSSFNTMILNLNSLRKICIEKDKIIEEQKLCSKDMERQLVERAHIIGEINLQKKKLEDEVKKFERLKKGMRKIKDNYLISHGLEHDGSLEARKSLMMILALVNSFDGELGIKRELAERGINDLSIYGMQDKDGEDTNNQRSNKSLLAKLKNRKSPKDRNKKPTLGSKKVAKMNKCKINLSALDDNDNK